MLTKLPAPRPARLALDGYAGQRALRVEVVGEIGSRWAIRFLEAGYLPRGSQAVVGDVLLWPKHDVLLNDAP